MSTTLNNRLTVQNYPLMLATQEKNKSRAPNILTTVIRVHRQASFAQSPICAFNTSDSTTIPLTVQNWQITS